MLTQAPKGTRDMLPQQAYLWQGLEARMRALAALWGYREIRTPVFEHTELFLRGVGDTTDIVNKEMYTFMDKGGRSITLKPEGTAGAVRAFIEAGLYAGSLPCKVYYLAARESYATWKATREIGEFDTRTFEVRARPEGHVEGLRPGMSAIMTVTK